MTLGVCQGHSSIASFSILTSASRGPSAIAELLGTRYRGVIYAVNAHIEVAISHSVSECQSDKSVEFAFFHKIGCHGNVP